MASIFRWTLLWALAFSTTGCIKSMAINALGDALSKGGGTYARDDDPELVRDATAFGLKTIESLLDAEPEHKGLRLAAVRGFTQYGFAFLQSEADFTEDSDYDLAEHLRERAVRMYGRAIRHGLAGLSIDREGFETRLRENTTKALASMETEDIGLLYWTAAAWAASVALDKDQAELAASLDLAEAMMMRAKALDETYGDGAIYDFLMAWDAGRPAAGGGSVERAKAHMARSLEISGGLRIAPYVSWAETVLVKRQDQAGFDAMLGKAIAFDVDSAPQYRLANLIAQRRAKWLMSRKEDLFL